VLALAAGLLTLFLSNVDLRGVSVSIRGAQPGWLLLSLASMVVNLAIRSLRWRFLLEPLGGASFGNAFRATAVGFAASSLLPARAGEVIRPYFLSRHERLTATGGFATIIVERLLDLVTVLTLLASFVLFFGRALTSANPTAFRWVTLSGATAGAAALAGLVILFVLAGHPARLGRAAARLERVLPARIAVLIARVVERFAGGLAVIRRPSRLVVALAWSFPLWLCIAFGLWAVAMAFSLGVPFTGSFLLIALLAIGVAVPTPGAVGGFHEAFRWTMTTFFGVPNESAVAAALVAHAFSILPTLLLGVVFAARAGMHLTGIRDFARRADAAAHHAA
jgi:uncharacterized protein (TIRG00374 family)